MILATVSIWIWQAQAIQIDLLFAALLAGSWLAWLGGYLILRGHAAGHPGGFFLGAYGALALAFLAKGPLALALTLPLSHPPPLGGFGGTGRMGEVKR